MSRNQRRQILLAASAFAAWPPIALAQAARGKVRVAILYNASRPVAGYLFDAFMEQMGERGWREGVNIEYVIREAKGDNTRLDPLAAELVALKPDLILVGPTPGALAAKKHTSTIPIVFTTVTDPVAARLVQSLSKPGGNATGTTSAVLGGGLSGKRLQILKEVFPTLHSVALLYDPSDAQDATTLQYAQAGARELTLDLRPFVAKGPDEFRASFGAMKRDKIGAVLLGSSIANFIHGKRIAELAIEHRIPTSAGNIQQVGNGMLMGYGLNLVSLFRRAAHYADRILRGARPADLPVEQPTVLEFHVNLKTARALGVKIPQGILLRADRVIE